MNIRVRQYREPDLKEMIRIWNEVVEDGVAFPQEEFLTEDRNKVKERRLPHFPESFIKYYSSFNFQSERSFNSYL